MLALPCRDHRPRFIQGHYSIFLRSAQGVWSRSCQPIEMQVPIAWRLEGCCEEPVASDFDSSRGHLWQRWAKRLASCRERSRFRDRFCLRRHSRGQQVNENSDAEGAKAQLDIRPGFWYDEGGGSGWRPVLGAAGEWRGARASASSSAVTIHQTAKS